MENRKKLKIALINPPISGHQVRGTGNYTRHLYQALAEKPEIEVDLINFGKQVDPYDLVHYPYFDPFFLTLPLIKKKPTIVTVHDLIPLKFPRYFPKGLKGEIKWRIQKLSLKSASAIITDSYAAKKDIAEYTGISQKQIKVIYLGVGKDFQVIRSEKKLKDVRKKLNLPKNFLLHVGDVNYNKNIPGLLKTFAQITQKYKNLYLVLVGYGFINNSPQLSQLLDLILKLKIQNKVQRLAHLKLAELVGVYNLASVYLQLSFAEGFGLPVLEAMACGCPVIASNFSSLPEIAGKAGILVNPNNVKEVIQAVDKILNNKEKRKDLINKGFEQAKLFTWEKCAQETLKVYKNLKNLEL